MKKYLVLTLALLGLTLSMPVSSAFAADDTIKDLPNTSWVDPASVPVVAKWEVAVDSNKPTKNSVFKGYNLGIKADKIFNSQENQWAKYGSFAVSLGACGKQPNDSEFKKIGSDGVIKYPTIFKADASKQTVCVWGKLPKEAMGIYDKNGTRYTLESAKKNKDKLKNDSIAYYRNDVTVNGTGVITNKQVSDDDYWDTFKESFKPFASGEAKLMYEPSWLNPFTPTFPKTGGIGSTTILVAGIGITVGAVLVAGIVYSRRKK